MRTIKTILFSVAIIFTLLFITNLHPAIADTIITGNIQQNTTWNTGGSPYRINSNVQVHKNATLKIDPGVTVIIDVDATFVIAGELIARGTAGNMITFTSSDRTDPRKRNVGVGRGLKFLKKAKTAKYKPEFIYDYPNNQVLLEYQSGSIFEFCSFEYFFQALNTKDTLPCIQHCNFIYCERAVGIDYSPNIPIRNRFFFYNNTVEYCNDGLKFGAHGSGSGFHEISYGLISGNRFRYCNRALVMDLGITTAFIFNNQFFQNTWGITDFYYTYYNHYYSDIGLFFVAHNTVTFNEHGFRFPRSACVLHNYIANNVAVSFKGLGAGICMGGTYGYVCNNTIQLNGVSTGGYGDGITLISQEKNKFSINRNNLGNSVGDMQDIYLVNAHNPNGNPANMVVDATTNSWGDSDPSNNIYDYSDDSNIGRVNYHPVSESAIIHAPLNTHPTLISPDNNKFFKETTRINFSWNPVSGATKYIVCTFGSQGAPSHNGKGFTKIIEVENATSTDITFPLNNLPYGMYTVHWFVVAGNDNGWSLPSEIRKVTYSPDKTLVTGKVFDITGATVPQTLLNQAEGGTLSDNNGNYTIMWSGNKQYFAIEKDDYVTTRTFPRGKREFNIFKNFITMSTAQRQALYDACYAIVDSTQGTVAGIVVNESGLPLFGAIVKLSPTIGNAYYLDSNGNVIRSRITTDTSGKFSFLNIPPGNYQISAVLSGYTFSPEITVEADSLTADALIGTSTTSSGGSGGGGGGGDSDNGDSGGGCFIATAAYGTSIAQEVRILCKVRDRYLLSNRIGRKFVKEYYIWSPALAEYIKKQPAISLMIRLFLKPVIAYCQLICK